MRAAVFVCKLSQIRYRWEGGAALCTTDVFSDCVVVLVAVWRRGVS